MTDPVSALKDKLATVDLSKSLKAFESSTSGFLSRKLLVTLVLAGVLLWLGLGHLEQVLGNLTLLAAIYLAGQTIHDCVAEVCKAKIRIAVVSKLRGDVLAKEE